MCLAQFTYIAEWEAIETSLQPLKNDVLLFDPNILYNANSYTPTIPLTMT
jgi:hypothetical protein